MVADAISLSSNSTAAGWLDRLYSQWKTIHGVTVNSVLEERRAREWRLRRCRMMSAVGWTCWMSSHSNRDWGHLKQCLCSLHVARIVRNKEGGKKA